MQKIKIFYKNRLPHIAPIGATFFVTFRLADSLPKHIVYSLKLKMDAAIEKLNIEKPDDYEEQINRQQKLFFKKYDNQLDHKPFGNCYLKRPEIAKIVKEKLHELDGNLYNLIAYTIMPNHIHLLFDTSSQIIDKKGHYLKEIPDHFKQLHQIMKYIKGSTAVKINPILGKKGVPFWQKDSYDHYIRNDREFGNVVEYILQNPVKARLVKSWDKYPYSFAKILDA